MALRVAAPLALAFAVATGLVSARPAWATPGAVELVREARAHEAAHEDDLALRRYAEAIALDPTLEDAYVGLGSLRLRLGDARESEHVFDAALFHAPGLPEAWLGRGRARHAMGSLRAADADLEAYISKKDDPDAHRELARWYAEEGLPLAQLAVWRRLLTLAERRGDAGLHREARLTVHAIELIVGTADPVREPPGGSAASTVRRGMARMEKRR
jgi:tetratricopeptide (TPR) repeat protein